MENLEKIVVITLFTLLILYATYVLIIKQFMPILKDQSKESKEEKKRKKAIDHKYTKEELIKYANEKLNLVVINDDILNTVNDFIADNDNLGGSTIHTFVDTLAHTYFREPFGIGQKHARTIAERYYKFLSQGIEGTIDNISSSYVPAAIRIRKELDDKEYMSPEGRKEYAERLLKLLNAIIDDINNNFDIIVQTKHSVNNNLLNEVDYIIENGGIN